MSLDTFSRYRFCVATTDANGNRVLDHRSRFLYRERADNIPHTVQDGDTLMSIAGRYYSSLDYAPQLFWVIGDFQLGADGQPAPILDPTVRLTAGTTLVVPSLQTVLNEALSPDRAPEHDVP